MIKYLLMLFASCFSELCFQRVIPQLESEMIIVAAALPASTVNSSKHN